MTNHRQGFATNRAVELIILLVIAGTLDLISSEPLLMKFNAIERRSDAEILLSLASCNVKMDTLMMNRAQKLANCGYGSFDAYHLAASEMARAHVLLTTDDRLIRRAARGIGKLQISVQNPISWLEKQGL